MEFIHPFLRFLPCTINLFIPFDFPFSFGHYNGMLVFDIGAPLAAGRTATLVIGEEKESKQLRQDSGISIN